MVYECSFVLEWLSRSGLNGMQFTILGFSAGSGLLLELGIK
jgi:predicted esterase